jgi:hypothetical protein
VFRLFRIDVQYEEGDAGVGADESLRVSYNSAVAYVIGKDGTSY